MSAQAEPTPAPGLTLGLLGAAAPLARFGWFARLQARELFVPPSLLDDYVRTSALISKATLVNTVGENIRFTEPPGWAGFLGPALILAGGRERELMRRVGTFAAPVASGQRAGDRRRVRAWHSAAAAGLVRGSAPHLAGGCLKPVTYGNPQTLWRIEPDE